MTFYWKAMKGKGWKYYCGSEVITNTFQTLKLRTNIKIVLPFKYLMFKIIWCMYFTCSSVPFCSVQPGLPSPQIYGKTLHILSH